MRMGSDGLSAAAFLNQSDEGELARVLYNYGDERQARRLAREIVRRRARQPFGVSDDLVNAIRAVLGPRAGPGDFARLFQAVRIAVNDELTGLARALVDLAPDVLGAVGDFVPALAPFAAGLGDRLVTAPDPLALGPLIAARLHGGEVVVLKASRGVALERILPALTVRATPRR